ncbi:MAG: hypothetical protein IJ424_04470 [Oscillospiraceae bacterium]|nr:hypothetical protein [Oscillospiraceae bacterium]
MTHEEKVLLDYKYCRKSAFKEALGALVSLSLFVVLCFYIYWLSLPAKAPTIELVEENPTKYLEIECEKQGTNNCWLMAAMSAASYRAGISAETDDVSEYVNSKHRIAQGGGDSTHEGLVYEYFGLTSTSGTEKLMCKQVIDIINQGYPIYCVIADERFKTAHAVVICGYEINAGNITYFIMDPFTAYVSSVEVDKKTGEFSFESNRVLYINQVRHRY